MSPLLPNGFMRELDMDAWIESYWLIWNFFETEKVQPLKIK